MDWNRDAGSRLGLVPGPDELGLDPFQSSMTLRQLDRGPRNGRLILSCLLHRLSIGLPLLEKDEQILLLLPCVG